MKRLLLVLALPAASVLGYGTFLIAGLPPRIQVRALAVEDPGATALMRQREREARRAGRGPRREQTAVPLSRISRNLIQAVVVAEDAKFLGHEGVDWQALEESLQRNVKAGRFARGGSTLTQQLAKNLFLGTEKSLTRKLRELLVARWLEEELTKKRILTLYLNVIEWGDGIYGCEAAALTYYGKPAADLDVEEAAGLAAMIPNPRRINPLVNPARHARAQRRMLWLMAHAGYVEQSLAGLGAEPPAEAEESGDSEPAEAEPTPPPR